MTELLPFLKELIQKQGLSAREQPIRELIESAWSPLADQIEVSKLGSLHALKKGTGEPRYSIMLAAHMDAIGLMVTGIEGSFLRITAIGGIDHRVLPSQPVTIHGEEDIPGIIVQPPAFLLPEDVSSGPVPLEYLLVDSGLSADETKKLVSVGDLITFRIPPIEMSEKTLAGPALDNRTSVAALTICLQTLQKRNHMWDVWAVATAQEEETLGGAFTSAFHIKPSVAIAVDVTIAKGPGTKDHRTFPLTEAITLGWGPNIHPKLHKGMKKIADEFEIPYKLAAMPRHSGTDAMAMQIVEQGIPTMVVSIPIRYMHTPVEVVALDQIKRAGRLIAEFAASLDENFMDGLGYELERGE